MVSLNAIFLIYISWDFTNTCFIPYLRYLISLELPRHTGRHILNIKYFYSLSIYMQYNVPSSKGWGGNFELF